MPDAPEAPIDTRRIAPRLLLMLAIFATLLFLPAGSLAWPGAWIFLTLLTVTAFSGMTWLARHDPDLLRERLKPPLQRDQQPWDRTLMLVFMPLWFGWYALMGL